MGTINRNIAGLVVGALFGGWHLLWSLLVALGWAQSLIDFIFWIHFIKPIYVIQPFSILLASTLVVVTAIIGYVIGNIFAMLWNQLHKMLWNQLHKT